MNEKEEVRCGNCNRIVRSGDKYCNNSHCEFQPPQKEHNLYCASRMDGKCYKDCDVSPQKNTNSWKDLFDKGFVWEQCCRDHYALFRVCNEADGENATGTRNLAHPDYVKAFICILLQNRNKEIVQMINKKKTKI